MDAVLLNVKAMPLDDDDGWGVTKDIKRYQRICVKENNSKGQSPSELSTKWSWAVDMEGV